MLCSACFAPFPHDRHDLVNFRIVGVQVSDAAPAAGDSITARALVYGGAGFYHDQLPTLSWAVAGVEASGPEVTLELPTAQEAWTLELTATHADGVTTEQAILRLEEGSGGDPVPPPVIEGIARAVVPLGLDSSAAELSLDARTALSALAAAEIAPGEAARLALELDDPEHYWARWMSVGARGSFLELSALHTDWLPADLLLDEEDAEVEIGPELAPALVSVAALAMDGQGANGWAFADLAWQLELDSEDGSTIHGEHAGRLFVLPGPLPDAGVYTVTLALDDDSAWGLQLDEIEPIEGEPAGWSPEELDCEHPLPEADSFELDWLASGLCSRPRLEGARVPMRFEYPPRTWGEQP